MKKSGNNPSSVVHSSISNFLVILFILLITAFASSVSAQQKTTVNVNEELNKLVNDIDKKNSKSDPQVGDKQVRIFLDKIEVLGQIDRPQAVYVILGSDPRIDDIGLDRSFFKEIFRPVDRSSVLKAVSRRSRDYIPWE